MDINIPYPEAVPASISDYIDPNFPVQVYYTDLSKMYMNHIRWHWHTEIEIIVVNYGDVEVFTDDKQIKLRAGQGLLLNQGVMHSVRPLREDDNTCTFYSVVFDPAFLFGNAENPLTEKYLSPIVNSGSIRAVELHEGNPWQESILDTVDNIIAANVTKRFGYELLIKSHLCNLWSSVLRKYAPENASVTKQPDKPSAVSPDEARVKSAILYIQEHYSEQITLDELSESIHLSKSECCRCFKRTLQVTPVEYIMKYRILKATLLLQQNAPEAQSMSDLAFSVGFNNASYFNKVFRQYMGCTPSDYKRQLKNGPQKKLGPFQELKL